MPQVLRPHELIIEYLVFRIVIVITVPPFTYAYRGRSLAVITGQGTEWFRPGAVQVVRGGDQEVSMFFRLIHFILEEHDISAVILHDGGIGDVGRARDIANGGAGEPPLGEEAQRCVQDLFAGPGATAGS